MTRFLLLITFLSLIIVKTEAQIHDPLAKKDSLIAHSSIKNYHDSVSFHSTKDSAYDTLKHQKLTTNYSIIYPFLSYQYWINKLFHSTIDSSTFIVYSGLKNTNMGGISLIDSTCNPLIIHQARDFVKKVPFSIFRFGAKKYVPIVTEYKPFSSFDFTSPLFYNYETHQIDTIDNSNHDVVCEDSVLHDPFFLKHFWGKDTVRKPTLIVRPFYENGMYFFKNDSLKNRYKTQSIFYLGFGINIGHIETHKIIPFVQISLSKYKINKAPPVTPNPDSIISIKQYILGAILPIYSSKDIHLRMKVGYNISIINESFYHVNDVTMGFQFGVGIERRFIRNTRIYIDYSYVYQKSNSQNFKDFDMTRLCFGLVL